MVGIYHLQVYVSTASGAAKSQAINPFWQSGLTFLRIHPSTKSDIVQCLSSLPPSIQDPVIEAVSSPIDLFFPLESRTQTRCRGTFWGPHPPACKRTCNESHDTRRRCGVKRGRANLGTACSASTYSWGQVGLKGDLNLLSHIYLPTPSLARTCTQNVD